MLSDSLSINSFFYQFPKADLHYHLLGGVRLETMLDLARKYSVELTEQEARSYYREFRSESGVTRGGATAQTLLYLLMREPEDYLRVVQEIAEDAKANSVRYIEAFWNPVRCQVDYKTVIKALALGIERAEQRTGVVIRLVACIGREQSNEEALSTLSLVLNHSHQHVVGIGLDCKSGEVTRECYRAIAQRVKGTDIRLSAHFSSGEQEWQDIEAAIEQLEVDRIDHGYSAIDNEVLTKYCAGQGITFTVAPSNTYFVKKWPDREQWKTNHPTRAMAQAGMTIIPCTDGWHLHDISSAECYRIMVEELGFDLDDVRQMMINSLEGAWIDNDLRQQWLQQWQSEFDQLRNRLTWEPELCWRKVDYVNSLSKAAIA
ncbi:hypothetical protein ACH42_16845 [Endozoicomonas sp. (ex Bugula neritina AB1)]|nr:hypothetical protein ACH42_16845 [Endozoicomonas sp. (ex Bugula neritina AB1)]